MEEEKKEQEQLIKDQEEKKEKIADGYIGKEEERIETMGGKIEEINRTKRPQPLEIKKQKYAEKKQEKVIKEVKTKKKRKGVLVKVWQLFFSKKHSDVVCDPIIGIDISDHSIEIMQLNQHKKIVAYGRFVLEKGTVDNGSILKQKELIVALKEAFKNAEILFPDIEREKEIKAIISLPESKTYIQYFDFENNNDLYHKTKERIKKIIPSPIEDLYWDFLEIKSRKDGAKILCALANQEIIDNYTEFLRAAGITPIVFDIESASIARSLLPDIYSPLDKKKKERKRKTKVFEDIMILDIGARTTNIAAYNDSGAMCLAVTFPCAGSLFTERIAEYLNISREEAERTKIEKGFQLNTEFFPALSEEALKIINEVKEAIDFYERDFRGNIKKIILAGGSALLPEIEDFFQKFFDIKVEIGDPLLKIKEKGDFVEKNKILYSNVIGLALRGISDDPVKDGINLFPRQKEST